MRWGVKCIRATMCGTIKYICLAQTLILFKGYTSNQNNLCPVPSRHITGDDTVETADEHLRSPSVGGYCREEMTLGLNDHYGKLFSDKLVACLHRKHGLFGVRSSSPCLSESTYLAR